MDKALHTCPVCLTEFNKSGHNIYCCKGCAEIAWRVMQGSGYMAYRQIRSQKYQDMVAYATKNNIRELVKKYKPSKKRNRSYAKN